MKQQEIKIQENNNNEVVSKAMDFIKRQLSEIKNITKEQLQPNDIVIGEVQAKTKNGEVVNALKVRRVPTDSELEDIRTMVQVSGINAIDLLMKRYYIMTINNQKTIFEKYTNIANRFYQAYPKAYVKEFVYHRNDKNEIVEVWCIMENEGKTHIGKALNNIKTQRPIVEAMETGAFKEILKYNYPHILNFYDEYDLDIIKTNQKAKEQEPNKLQQELSKMIEESK